MSGTVRVALAQYDFPVGAIEANKKKVLATIRAARDEKQADILLFPALTLCGPVPGMLLQRPALLTACARALQEIAGQVRGIAVLIGAIAAARQARLYDSVILKTLGATRWQVLGVQALEYALLAAVLAVVALAIGGFAAWYVIVRVFAFTWAPDWGVVLAVLAGGAAVTLGLGLIGSIPLMSVRPARALRQL